MTLRASRVRPVLAACTLLTISLLLTSCGDPLVTAYGTTDGASVNGVAVLKTRWTAAFTAKTLFRLSSRLDDCDMILHVQRGSGLPGAQACTWIENWLQAVDGRQFVLVLRDGNVAPWLCRRWAAEALSESLTLDETAAARLRALAERLETRAEVESENPTADHCPLFERKLIAEWQPEALAGALPPTFSLRSEATAMNATPVLRATARNGEAHAWAIAVPIGGSRLVVVANATPLVDGALVAGEARLLLRTWFDELRSYREDAKPEVSGAAWVESLAVRESPKPPNILAMLFGTPPFSWVIIHALALGVAFLAWKGAWLGRVSPPRADAAERFSRHVDALALQLRDADAVASCANALAIHAGRPLEKKPSDLTDALAQVAIVCRPQTAKYTKRKEKKP